MAGKYKLPLKKVGGSIYCLIPSGLAEQLDVKGDKEILAEFWKYGDIIREMCENYSSLGQEVILVNKDDKELLGIVAFVDNTSITFVSDDKHYIIPFNYIKELKEDKNGES